MRSHTSPRWMATSLLASKPSLTFPLLISSTVTLSICSKSAVPPIITTSQLFRLKTSMVDPPCLIRIVRFTPAPGARRYATGQQKHLHHGAGSRLDFRGRFAHLHPGDAFD